jgi:hypothetical protein
VSGSSPPVAQKYRVLDDGVEDSWQEGVPGFAGGDRSMAGDSIGKCSVSSYVRMVPSSNVEDVLLAMFMFGDE